MGNKLCGGDTTTSTSTADRNSRSRKSTETDTEIFGELIGTIRDQKWEDKYKVVKKLGAGITGAVYKVEHKTMEGKLFALKSVNLDKLDTAQLKELRNEVALLKKLDHPHIVRLYETFESDTTMDLVMELLEGGDLYDAYKGRKEEFTEKKICELIRQLVSAVSYCHKFDIIHRDIKPANVCFRTGERDSIVLIDFGIGKITPTSSMSLWGSRAKQTMCGTPVYVAPEILTGNYTEKVDVWAIGVLAHLYLVGRVPFQGRNQSETLKKVQQHTKLSFHASCWKSISAEAKDFIQQMLEPIPAKRLSASQALEHPWFTTNKTKIGAKRMSIIHHDVLKNINEYAKFSPVKKMAMMAVAHTLDGAQMKKLQLAFADIDVDNSGTLNREELMSLLKEQENLSTEDMENIFDSLDFDRTGKIHYGEFLAAAADTSGFLEKNSLRVAFDRLDKDKSGFISVENLKKIAGKVYSEEAITEFLKSADLKNNGVIDFDEFLVLMEPSKPSSSLDAVGAEDVAPEVEPSA